MKILFGVQGTGNGHISRARILAQYLAQQELDVQFLFSGRPREQLFDMDVFGDYWYRQGLTFVTENGSVNHLKTAKVNNIFTFVRDIRRLPLDDFDLVITDFEPVTAWAAKLAHKRVLGVGHQYAFGDGTPLTGDTWLTRTIMKYFAPANYNVGLHWHPYASNVLPPIIDTELALAQRKQHILVYLPFENQQKITELLQQIPSIEFIQYSPELVDSNVNNVKQRKTCYQGFKRDLAGASGVICNSGFELISECLHLGLPILTKPLQGQMEQHSNALALEQLYFANVIDQLTVEKVSQWLSDKPKIERKPMPNVAKALADWIASGDWHEHKKLSERLWQQAPGLLKQTVKSA